jgi:hypothetical protein
MKHWSFAVVPFFALLPLFALLFFATPQTDDFCIGSGVSSFGTYEILYDYYTTWAGRLFSKFIMILPNRISNATEIDLFLLYRLELIVILGGLIASVAPWFIGEHAIIGGRGGIVLLPLFLLAIIGASVRVREMLYWLPGSVTYVAPGAAVLFVIFVLYRPIVEAGMYWRPVQDRERSRQTLAWWLAVGAALLAALSNEFTGPGIIALAILSMITRQYLGLSRELAGHLALVLAATLGLMVIALAPGNDLRLMVHDGSGRYWTSIAWGVVESLEFLVSRPLLPAALAWFVALIWCANGLAIEPPTPEQRRRATVAGLSLFACGLAFTYVAFAIGHFGRGTDLPKRAENQILFVTLTTLSLAVNLLVPVYRPAVRALAERLPRLIRTKAVPIVLVLVLVNPASWQALHLLAFHASTYDLENRERIAMLTAASGPSATVPPLSIPHRSLLFGADLRAGEPHLWPNSCVAKYFGLDRVVVIPSLGDKDSSHRDPALAR